jgi:serine/threonine protein kinase
VSLCLFNRFSLLIQYPKHLARHLNAMEAPISTLGDRYRIQSLLGRQTGRRTFLATDLQRNCSVVIKLILFGPDFTWDDLKLFEREAAVLKSLDHAAIPQYLDYFEVDTPLGKGFALVQTYIEAQSLQQWVQAGRTFSEAELIAIAQSLLTILDYLHSRQPAVIHRDIKPSNVLLGDRSGNSPGQVYLIDFGAVQTAAHGGTQTIVGTYGYMPPEQFGGRATASSDLYSLGATLIYLATGQHPAELEANSLQLEFGQWSTLSPQFNQWLRQMVQSTPAKRFTHVGDALQFLKHPSSQDLALLMQPPVGSHIKIEHQDGQLWIQLPHAYFSSTAWFEQLLGIGTGLAGFTLFVMIFIVSPWHIVSLLVFIYLPDKISKCRCYKILINDEKVLFQSLFLRFKLESRSHRREDIIQLNFGRIPLTGWIKEAIPIEQHSHQLIIHIGAKPHVIFSQNQIEMSWLAHELSRFLNLPLLPLAGREAIEEETENPVAVDILGDRHDV